jgi:hypothetical protein
VTPLDAAWQGALAAEQRAVFGYGLVGPRLAAADRGTALEFATDHSTLRDATATALSGAGVPPAPPAVDYPDLPPPASPAAARRLALGLEEHCAAAWRYLYLRAASSTDRRAAALRSTAQTNLTASATRAARWRGGPTAFPGM